MKLPCVWIVLVPALVGTGCLGLKPARDVTRHLVLSAPEVAAPEPGTPASGPVVAIIPIGIPEYLDNPWLAIREHENELRYSSVYRWGEPLAHGVRRVLATQLRRLLPGARIETGSWRPGSVDWELTLYLDRFDALEDGRVELEARWRITTPLAAKPAAAGVAHTERTGPPPDVDPLGAASALSLALTDLAEELAASITAANR